jgi:hypothetical protein
MNLAYDVAILFERRDNQSAQQVGRVFRLHKLSVKMVNSASNQAELELRSCKILCVVITGPVSNRNRRIVRLWTRQRSNLTVYGIFLSPVVHGLPLALQKRRQAIYWPDILSGRSSSKIFLLHLRSAIERCLVLLDRIAEASDFAETDFHFDILAFCFAHFDKPVLYQSAAGHPIVSGMEREIPEGVIVDRVSFSLWTRVTVVPGTAVDLDLVVHKASDSGLMHEDLIG